jgi:hypothetical protein
VVAFDSPEFNIYGLSDGMKERGWSLNCLQFPISVHICVTRNRFQAPLLVKQDTEKLRHKKKTKFRLVVPAFLCPKNTTELCPQKIGRYASQYDNLKRIIKDYKIIPPN